VTKNAMKSYQAAQHSVG